MHEPFEPKCTFCAKFVRCFADDSPLAEWGYCSDRRGDAAGRKALGELERLADGGDYRRLLERASAVGVFQETDDGCERFVPRTVRSETGRPGAGFG